MEKTPSGIIPLAPNQFRASVGDFVCTIEVLDGKTVLVDGEKFSFNFADSVEGTISLIMDGYVYRVLVPNSNHERGHNSIQLNVNGHLHDVTIEDRRSLIRKNLLQARPRSTVFQEIKAPMPGKVVRIEVNQGDSVKPGSGVVVLEAMKMENEIKSISEGRVEKIYVEPGRAVEKGEVLVSIRPN